MGTIFLVKIVLTQIYNCNACMVCSFLSALFLIFFSAIGNPNLTFSFKSINDVEARPSEERIHCPLTKQNLFLYLFHFFLQIHKKTYLKYTDPKLAAYNKSKN